MSRPDATPAGRLYGAAERPARLVRAICQMVLGAGLGVALILKLYMLVLTDHQCVADGATLGNAIRCTPALVLMAQTLALAAAFELAYRLFTEGIETVLKPLILGLGAALLMILSQMSGNAGAWQSALVLAALTVLLAVLFYIRERLRAERVGRVRRDRGSPDADPDTSA